MFCRECGAKIDDVKFCSECGTPIKSIQNVPIEDITYNHEYLSSHNSKWKRPLGAWLGVLGLFTFFTITNSELPFLIFIFAIIIYKSYYTKNYTVDLNVL